MKKLESVTLQSLFEESRSGSLPVLMDIEHDLIQWGDDDLEQENGHLRLINSNTPVIFNGHRYLPAYFQFILPQEESNKIGQTSITISALDKRVVEIIRSINSAPKATIEAMYANINEYEFVFSRRYRYEFAMDRVNWDASTAKWNLIYDKTMQNNIPRDLATASRVPGVTADEA